MYYDAESLITLMIYSKVVRAYHDLFLQVPILFDEGTFDLIHFVEFYLVLLVSFL